MLRMPFVRFMLKLHVLCLLLEVCHVVDLKFLINSCRHYVGDSNENSMDKLLSLSDKYRPENMTQVNRRRHVINRHPVCMTSSSWSNGPFLTTLTTEDNTGYCKPIVKLHHILSTHNVLPYTGPIVRRLWVTLTFFKISPIAFKAAVLYKIIGLLTCPTQVTQVLKRSCRPPHNLKVDMWRMTSNDLYYTFLGILWNEMKLI